MKIYNIAFLLLFSFPLVCNDGLQFSVSSASADSLQTHQGANAGAANLVFKSTDGGKTWQDVSKGLPEDLQQTAFFADESGFYLHSGTGIYHSTPYSAGSFWTKEILSDVYSNIGHGKAGIFAYSNSGFVLQKMKGTDLWLPKYPNFQGKQVHTIFESAGGSVFISTNTGLFKSDNSGNTWKHVHTGGWVRKVVEFNGVLLATGQAGILGSTDNGENWDPVISEGGVGIDVERITGGFAAINFNTVSNTRRMRTTYDGGKTWQPVDAGLPSPFSFGLFRQTLNAGLPPEAFITSLVQVGNDSYCGHPTGILRSSDKGKTWEMVLPAIGKKVFSLFVSGNVIFAIPRMSGC